MRKAWCSVLSAGFLVASLSVAAHAGNPVTTNLDVMDTLAGQVLLDVLAGVPSEHQVRDIILVPYANDERYDFLDYVFTRVLTMNGYRTRALTGKTVNDTTLSSSLILEYHALNFTLRYPKIYRAYLLGGKKVKREADIKLHARLVDPVDETIVWVGESSKHYEDQFSYSHVDDVELGDFSFTKPPHDTTNWGRIVEPVVVSGIIVGLIYLFFSNQTDE